MMPKPTKMKTAKLKKEACTTSSILHAMLNDSIGAMDILQSIEGRGDTVFTYLCLADAALQGEVKREVCERVLVELKSGNLVGIGITYRAEPPWESAGSNARADISEIMRRRREIRDAAPHSITRLALSTIPGGSGSESFLYWPFLATLELTLRDQSAPKTIRRAKSRSQAQPIGARPAFRPVSLTNPDEANVKQVIDTWMRAGHHARKLAAAIAVTARVDWRASRPLRTLGLLQFETLLTADKSFFGAGVGEDILNHALVKPIQRAKRAKRAKGAYTREEVIDIWWTEALHSTAVRHKPPFVKL